MSMIDPNIIEKLKPYRLLIIGVGLLVLIGVVAGLIGWIGDWSFTRSIDKKKANVNAAIDEVKAINANIEAEKKALANAMTNVAIAKDDYLESVNATDGAREAVNASIERMKQAANRSGNVNARDVEEAMRGL
jgi:hypothetical protein